MGIIPGLWLGKKIVVTGHTGFKGAWLTYILNSLGVEVYGISLPAIKPRSLYEDAEIAKLVKQEFIQDIRNLDKLESIFDEVKPDYVFHLAAQALVRESVLDPIATISTNVLGTSNLLIAAFKHSNLLGITVATTDKVYENEEKGKSFTENDKLGGTDPYSASKAATEIISKALTCSNNRHKIPVATVRAGNVIGGGDWASDRLVPDIVRALESMQALQIRYITASRPFQHVLDCIYGYLLVAQNHIASKSVETFNSYNFGPDSSLTVSSMIQEFSLAFKSQIKIEEIKSQINEQNQLFLDNSKAKHELKWAPNYSPVQSIKETANWYIKFLKKENISEIMQESINDYGRFKNGM